MKVIALMFLVGTARAASTDTVKAPIQMAKVKTCIDGSLLGKNPDGRICWAADYDSVAAKVLDIFAELRSENQKLELQVDLLTKEVLSLRAQKNDARR